ncbi:MAG TPA: hypothetical protein VFJ43_10920 [Bacteroidia bacterium]|nr:hypothetical protein [Bacteroidia bacterium]
MIKETNFKGIRGLQIIKAAPLALLLLQGKQALADETAAKASDSGTSALEILGYVAMIIGVILLAWIIGAAQSKNSSKPSAGDVAHRHHRHFDHPNDPHFRKLRKKTS